MASAVSPHRCCVASGFLPPHRATERCCDCSAGRRPVAVGLVRSPAFLAVQGNAGRSGNSREPALKQDGTPRIIYHGATKPVESFDSGQVIPPNQDASLAQIADGCRITLCSFEVVSCVHRQSASRLRLNFSTKCKTSNSWKRASRRPTRSSRRSERRFTGSDTKALLRRLRRRPRLMTPLHLLPFLRRRARQVHSRGCWLWPSLPFPFSLFHSVVSNRQRLTTVRLFLARRVLSL